MSITNLQPTRALKVLVWDDVTFIPYPTIVSSGTATSTATSLLVDSTASFITNNVSVGDIVYNYSNLRTATVVAIVSQTTLQISAHIMTSGQLYTVYLGNANTGCVLHIGVAAATGVRVLTASNEDVTFTAVNSNTFIPVKVVKIFTTGTNSTATITALW
jgi:hypothetical protein